ncbi:hypothetical protein CEUSTIGMA_g3141.t1 [Chlamydomonas eustigma]|uniref:Uncharacterized protein n=1 Tax=Chlamydomonas eustigma TaxID=1157962 RepID=A0A250WXX1_9CHLO|nr:hypothetical protein CEUSTIGMA_g3141.t1 [Chlamydomonas eustigma]|eukprot:GAX75698.1 hypothetical protein CEUSTIGMA_g3141.t1 [Chlamydomonas eustigma]
MHCILLMKTHLKVLGRSEEQWKADIGSKRFRSALREFLDTWFGNDEEKFDKLLSNPHIPPEQIAEIKRKFETRKDNRRRQVTEWCKATFEHPDFPHVRPLLKQMLEVTPVPVVDHRKDGAKTEGLIYDLVLRELPEGWRLYSGARLLKVDGEPFPNKKLLKGEADILLVDPLGIVQAVIEVKTASGNIFLALHEDVIRLSALINLVGGRRVQFSPADRSVVTLQFSPLLTPVYVLGCEVDSSEVSSLVKRAYGKLSTVELAKILSTQVYLRTWTQGVLECLILVW